jgi:hypothetical protein
MDAIHRMLSSINIMEDPTMNKINYTMSIASLLLICNFWAIKSFAQDNYNTSLIGHWTDPSCHACDLDVIGNYAYVATGETGLYVLDISNPASPNVIDKINVNTEYIPESVAL